MTYVQFPNHPIGCVCTTCNLITVMPATGPVWNNPKGWECPKCATCHAPWVPQCNACAPKNPSGVHATQDGC